MISTIERRSKTDFERIEKHTTEKISSVKQDVETMKSEFLEIIHEELDEGLTSMRREIVNDIIVFLEGSKNWTRDVVL
jgi:hypothetical protein